MTADSRATGCIAISAVVDLLATPDVDLHGGNSYAKNDTIAMQPVAPHQNSDQNRARYASPKGTGRSAPRLPRTCSAALRTSLPSTTAGRLREWSGTNSIRGRNHPTARELRARPAARRAA